MGMFDNGGDREDFRRMMREEHDRERSGGGLDSLLDDLAGPIIIGLIVVVLIGGALGWLDQQFGWHLLDTVKGWFHELVGSVSEGNGK